MCGCASAAPTAPAKPLMVGSSNGQVARIRPTVNYRGLRVGKVAWVTGTGVQPLVDMGIFRIV